MTLAYVLEQALGNIVEDAEHPCHCPTVLLTHFRRESPHQLALSPPLHEQRTTPVRHVGTGTFLQ